MNTLNFIDTDILVYTDDNDAPDKQQRALDIVAEARLSGTGVISTQVLQEYYIATTRKLGVSVDIARHKVELFSRLNLVPIDPSAILAAIDLQRLHPMGFWDALIIQCALKGGCTALLSEHREHGRRLGSLEFVNPFI